MITKKLYTKLMWEEISNENFEHISEIIERVIKIIELKWYWIWEVWYYFNENIEDLVYFNKLAKGDAVKLMDKAEAFLYELKEIDFI